MEYINALVPTNLLQSVSSAGSELTRRVWSQAPPPQRPFRVCDHKRNIRKGLMAGTLHELLVKARETLLVSGIISLVLDEDGTLVETEEFFEALEDNTTLMVLQKGQKWSHCKGGSRTYALSREKPRNSQDIARITFDVYKLNPRDLFGSLNISATFYGLYSMSCDFKCLGPKKVLREILRVASTIMQGVGHILLGASHYIRRLLEGGDSWHPHVRLSAYEG
ncbi:LOW QUALITY PROTEIN: cell death activator CIDE-B [Sceloporus undulatus]|uniref:LOW QUALITY PROTEIN: cell death activator CIDE-B n=1 Tax=Sceloporus undulatus TaxID=8520 RepID=UPI001C4D3FA6|nr:LOW QUALITY PROTEIN: cell death activator CIDE-B [Sceloporus undulatus]